MKKGRKKKTGRKTLYSDDKLIRAGQLAEEGHSNKEIAEKLGISLKTFYDWKDGHKLFDKVLSVGRRRFVEGNVEPAYLKQAAPHDEVVETHELRGRGKKKQMTLVGKRVAKNVVNAMAAEKILKVHKPEQYGDKLQIVGGLKVSFNIQKNYAGDTRKSD